MTELRQKMIRAMELKIFPTTLKEPALPPSQALPGTIGDPPIRLQIR